MTKIERVMNCTRHKSASYTKTQDWLLVKVCIGNQPAYGALPQEIPGRIYKSVHGVRLPPGRLPAAWTRGPDPVLSTQQRGQALAIPAAVT